MYKSYFKIAWRNLVRNKTFSIINISGLAIGLSCFLLIALYVMDELSYDRYFKNADNIYRINADVNFGGALSETPLTSDAMGAALQQDYPQVIMYAREYNFNGSKLVKKGNEYLQETSVTHVDSTFFRMFQLPAIAGNLASALDEPNTVVLTETAANKYFGTTNAIGKVLLTEDNKAGYKVMAVIKDVPENTHFHYNCYFSMKNVQYDWGSYLSHNFRTYLMLKPGTDSKAFEKNFLQYTDKYVVPVAKQLMQVSSMAEFEKSGNFLRYSLIPLTKIHLYSHRQFDIEPGGNIQYVYIFSAVALFILLIACINFMNLTTARSTNRAKEVGIRKVLGTERNKLVFQFLTESTLMAVFSLVLALVIAYLALPVFNDVASKHMSMLSIFSPVLLSIIIALPLVVGLLAGSYPAFFLSAFKPIEVLKGKLKMGSKSGGLRSVLVVFQFATSLILIIGTVTIYNQLHYIQTKNIGYNKEQVLIVNRAYVLGANLDAFKNDILNITGVRGATVSNFLPVAGSARSDNPVFKSAVMDAKEGISMQQWDVDEKYLQVMGMQLNKGRFFSKDFAADSSAVVLNQTAVKMLGYGNDVLGKKIYIPLAFNDNSGATKVCTVIGVVNDFNFESMHQAVGPLCLFLGNSQFAMSFKITGNNTAGILQQVQQHWKAIVPGMPFNYRFLDDSFDAMYRADQRVGKIALIFAVLAIVIASLGLFGLATFVAEQRTKEIGVRKVLGASVQSIVQLLSKEFVKLVLVAFVVAAPIAYYCMHVWLQDFAYRITISWWIFAAAGVAALVITLATVSVQAIKAALANPVKSLRTE